MPWKPTGYAAVEPVWAFQRDSVLTAVDNLNLTGRLTALTAAFTDAGLDHPELVPLDIATPFTDFDALWTPFTGGQGSGPSYLVSLDTEKQSALKESMRERVPVNPGGSISLTARAWAIRATVRG